MEANGARVDNLEALRLALEDICLGAAVVVKTELHVFGSDWLTVVEFHPWPEPEGGTARILGKFEALGQCWVIKELFAMILDQRIVDRGEEVIRRGGTVVLLRVEPARSEPSMPGQDEFPLRHHLGGR